MNFEKTGLTDLLTEEDAERIFDRFYTADKTRSSMNTGLGLAITKELVNKTGGEITAAYREGFLTVSVKYKLEG